MKTLADVLLLGDPRLYEVCAPVTEADLPLVPGWVAGLQRWDIGLVSLTDAINTASALGRLVLNLFASLAEFEREFIRERTLAGLAAARARGRIGGRKPGLSEEAQRTARAAEPPTRPMNSASTTWSAACASARPPFTSICTTAAWPCTPAPCPAPSRAQRHDKGGRHRKRRTGGIFAADYAEITLLHPSTARLASFRLGPGGLGIAPGRGAPPAGAPTGPARGLGRGPANRSHAAHAHARRAQVQRNRRRAAPPRLGALFHCLALGAGAGRPAPADRRVEGVVAMLLDATQRAAAPLTAERLFGWHAALFPTSYSGLYPLQVGAWRTGPVQVVSGPLGRERVHYDAPPATDLDAQMQQFLAWFNADQGLDPVLKAGLAHFWFVTMHPFDDGTGRIARAITDLQLTRADGTGQRCYSMPAQIQAECQAYYDLLETSQRGPLDVTPWMTWFLECLGRACRPPSRPWARC